MNRKHFENPLFTNCGPQATLFDTPNPTSQPAAAGPAVDALADLAHFHGSGSVYRHALAKRLCFTEGVDHLREVAGAYWLVDAIASYFGNRGKIARANERFRALHFWTLRKSEGGAILEAKEDSDCPPVVCQEIEFTDFPFPASGEFKLFCAACATGWVLMLPSEY